MPKPHPRMADYGIPDFETKAAVIEQQHIAIKCTGDEKIRSRLRYCLKHIEKPRKAEELSRCHAICAVCNYRRRLLFIPDVVEDMYFRNVRGAHSTLADMTWRRPQGELDTFEPSRAFKRIRAELTAAASDLGMDFFAVCAWEASLTDDKDYSKGPTQAERSKRRTWHNHFHVVSFSDEPLVLAEHLQSRLNLESDKYMAPFMTIPSFCPGRHLAYATKLDPGRRAFRMDARGHSNPKPRSLLLKRKKELFALLETFQQRERVRFWATGEEGKELISKINGQQ